jgi:hypothetical protein
MATSPEEAQALARRAGEARAAQCFETLRGTYGDAKIQSSVEKSAAEKELTEEEKLIANAQTLATAALRGLVVAQLKAEGRDLPSAEIDGLGTHVQDAYTLTWAGLFADMTRFPK